MTNPDRKQTAVDFLRHARAGDRAALERLVAPGARHHNAYFAAGMPALIDAMMDAARAAPGGPFDVKLVVGEGDHVVVHSHVRREAGDRGMSVVHIFRFQGDRVAELWDVGQPVPADNPNADGMF